MSDQVREVARCEGFDVGTEYGQLVMRGAFRYDGSGQGLGYSIDSAFIRSFMDVFRVDHLKHVNGRYCWVTHTHSKILKVEPILPSDGETFDVLAWANDALGRSRK